jgi:hypothetical protein
MEGTTWKSVRNVSGNIKIDLREIVFGSVYWIDLAQDRDC